MKRNFVLISIFSFLFVFVKSDTYFKKNFYHNVYNLDPECKTIKRFAYDGFLYESKQFSLQLFFNELSHKNCTSSIKYECKKKNFLYTNFNSVLYAYFCDKSSFFEMCSKILTDLTKQTIENILKLNNKELSNLLLNHYSLESKNTESCILVPMYSSFDILEEKNLTFFEIKEFNFFNTNWTIIPGDPTDLNEKKNGYK